MAQDASLPADVKQVSACVKALAPKDVQSEVVGKAGGFTVLAGSGPITGTSGGLEDGDVRVVALMARNGRRAFLFTARARPNVVEVSRWGYVLEKKADGWHVTEGNGGQATYEAVKQHFENKSLGQYRIPKSASTGSFQCVRPYPYP